MSTTAEGRSIDVAPRKSPPALLAFVLALLAIPGTTIAWDLPKGGLWIGLPLAVGAIALGVRSMRSAPGRRPRLAIAAVVIAALTLLQMAIYTVVSIAS